MKITRIELNNIKKEINVHDFKTRSIILHLYVTIEHNKKYSARWGDLVLKPETVKYLLRGDEK